MRDNVFLIGKALFFYASMTLFPSVGLYSPVPGCGKTTVIAAYLAHEYAHEIVSFANPVKDIVDAFLEKVGVEPEMIRKYRTLSKEFVIPQLGVSYRHLAQTLSTEWGRQCIYPNVWVDATSSTIKNLRKTGATAFVIDDLRFPNEYHALRASGFQLWKVIRDVDGNATHASDSALEDPGYNFDRIITNNGSKEDVYAQINQAMQELICA